MKRLNVLFLSTAVLYLSGCSKKDDDEGKNLGPSITDSQIASLYSLADKECQSKNEGLALSQQTVYEFSSGQTTQSTKTLTESSSSGQLGIKGVGIQATYFGLHIRAQCKPGGIDCKNEQLVSKYRPLKVCQAGKTFPQNSYEGIGLTSMAHIGAAHSFYRSLPEADEDIAIPNLFVIPVIEKVIVDSAAGTSKSTYVSDNLAYVHDYIGAPAYFIYPKGAASQRLGIWKNMNLWEAPWTLAHEFGHHILKTHTGVTSFSDLRKNSHLSHGLIHLPEVKPDFEVSRTAGGNREVDRDLFWGAMDEGFADLMGYYARGSKPGQASGIDCFAKNRDVELPNFANGSPKTIDANNLRIFMSREDIRTPSDCAYPDMQDIHIVGAVMAYGVNKIFDQKIGKSEGDEAAKAKASMLLRWAARLKDVSTSTSFQFQDLVIPALQIASTDGKLSADQCATVKQVFPAFQSEWQSSGKIKCL